MVNTQKRQRFKFKSFKHLFGNVETGQKCMIRFVSERKKCLFKNLAIVCKLSRYFSLYLENLLNMKGHIPQNIEIRKASRRQSIKKPNKQFNGKIFRSSGRFAILRTAQRYTFSIKTTENVRIFLYKKEHLTTVYFRQMYKKFQLCTIKN